MTEQTTELRELIAQVDDPQLRDALLLKALPIAQRADDVATLLEYRRRVAVDGVVSPVDETDPYMKGLGDALSLVLLAHGLADDEDNPRAAHVALDNVAAALAEQGYRHRDPDPIVERDNSRGLGRMVDIPGGRSGNVSVYESSAATYPHVWLKVTEEAGSRLDRRDTEATVHLRAESAWLLARQLVALVRNHYHGLDVEELTSPSEGDEVVAYLQHGSMIGTVELIGEDNLEFGIMSTPLANADTVFVIRKADEG